MIDVAFTEFPNVVISRRLEDEQRQQKSAVIATMRPLDISYSKNFVFTQHRLNDYVEKELGLLQEDWDGYGSCSIDQNVLAHTLFLFNQLPNAFLKDISKDDILPTSNGTITIEWNNGINELLLDIGKDISTYYIQNNGSVKKINNHFVITNTTEMRTFIKDLKKFFFD